MSASSGQMYAPEVGFIVQACVQKPFAKPMLDDSHTAASVKLGSLQSATLEQAPPIHPAFNSWPPPTELPPPAALPPPLWPPPVALPPPVWPPPPPPVTVDEPQAAASRKKERTVARLNMGERAYWNLRRESTRGGSKMRGRPSGPPGADSPRRISARWVAPGGA